MLSPPSSFECWRFPGSDVSFWFPGSNTSFSSWFSSNDVPTQGFSEFAIIPFASSWSSSVASIPCDSNVLRSASSVAWDNIANSSVPGRNSINWISAHGGVLSSFVHWLTREQARARLANDPWVCVGDGLESSRARASTSVPWVPFASTGVPLVPFGSTGGGLESPRVGSAIAWSWAAVGVT